MQGTALRLLLTPRARALPLLLTPRVRAQAEWPHLLIADAVVVVVIVAGVPDAVLVKVFLPRVRQEGTVVLRAEEAGQLQKHSQERPFFR